MAQTPGRSFKSGLPHEAYKTARRMLLDVNRYFNLCDLHKKNYTVPGLALHLGLKTKMLSNYQSDDHPDYQKVVDYALTRIEAYTVEKLFETKGSTKGIEFLMQNTANYANKSDVNSKTEMEISEKQKIQQLPDSEVKQRLAVLGEKIKQFPDLNATKYRKEG